MENLSKFQLNGLRAVVAVARFGTLAEAARAVGVTPGAISKHIIGVEQQLGQALFARTPSGFVVLPHSASFVADLTEGFMGINAACSSLRKHQTSNLRVTVAPVFARHWLIPRLSSFQSKHNDLRLMIDASADVVDLSRGEYSCAIRFKRDQNRGDEESHLLTHEVFPVCSPQIAERLNCVSDLAHVPVIRDVSRNVDWQNWLAVADSSALRFHNEICLSNSDLALDAAISGLGVALVWQTQAINAIIAGQLEIPFPISLESGGTYMFVERTASMHRSPTKIFRNWLQMQLIASQTAFKRALRQSITRAE